MSANGVQIRDVQVLELNEPTRHMVVGVIVDCNTPEELNLPSSRIQAGEKLQPALKYLHDEGFITAPVIPKQWQIVVFAALRNPKT